MPPTNHDTQNDEESVAFLPFSAINEFMTHEYRLEVVRSALLSLGKVPGKNPAALNHLVRRHVSIPGFRSSDKAPIPLKVKPLAHEFEHNPEVAAEVISAWADGHPGLRQQVYDLLSSRSWELLPLDADRRRLPGFQTTWPVGQDFDTIYQAFQEKHPDQSVEKNDVSLMAVWLGGRLPLQVEDQEEDG